LKESVADEVAETMLSGDLRTFPDRRDLESESDRDARVSAPGTGRYAMSARGFSEAERQVVTALIETKAINFEAIGQVIAKNGASATVQFDGDDVFCGTMRRFVRVFRLRDELAGLEHLADLRNVVGQELKR
jgi:hypothetical protein